MRDAPSVSVPVGRSRFGQWLALGLTVLGALPLAGWTLASPAPLRQGAVALLLALLGGWAWHSQRPRWQGVLHGRAGDWFLLDGPEPQGVDVAVTLDLQCLLLLRAVPRQGGGIRWFWLTPRGDAAHWQAVRRAVHAPHAAPTDGQECAAPSL